MKKLLLSLAVVSLAGCAGNATKEDINLDSVKPSNWQSKVKLYMDDRLKDPTDAIYKFSRLGVESCREYALVKPNYNVWTARVSINGRNSFGAYAGSKEYRFYFLNGEIVEAKDEIHRFFPECQKLILKYRDN